MGLHYGTPIERAPFGYLRLREAAEAALARRGPCDFPYLWRVEAASYSVGDEHGDWTLTPARLELHFVSVRKWTPTGARLYTGQHCDLRDGRKQYASRTPGEALKQFIRRRTSQIWILEGQLSRARHELDLANRPYTFAPEPITCAGYVPG